MSLKSEPTYSDLPSVKCCDCQILEILKNILGTLKTRLAKHWGDSKHFSSTSAATYTYYQTNKDQTQNIVYSQFYMNNKLGLNWAKLRSNSELALL